MDYTNLLNIASEVIVKVAAVATINSWLVDFIIAPVKKIEKFANYEFWWLPYLAVATGLCFAFFGDVNLFGSVFENIILGKIVTGIAIGGGAKQIHEWFDPSNEDVRVI